MAGKLGFICYVILPNGETVCTDQLTPEQKEEWKNNMRSRLSENMSDYYTQHPEEYRDVRKGKKENENKRENVSVSDGNNMGDVRGTDNPIRPCGEI